MNGNNAVFLIAFLLAFIAFGILLGVLAVLIIIGKSRTPLTEQEGDCVQITLNDLGWTQ